MLGFSAVSQTALSALPDEDVSGSASTAQGQTASGTGALTFSGAASTAQGQTVAGTGALAYTANGGTSQGQTLVGAGALTVSGSAATAQAQTTAGTGGIPIPISGTGDTAQAQTADGQGQGATPVFGGGGAPRIYVHRPPAISGSVSTDQGPQRSFGFGIVVEPAPVYDEELEAFALMLAEV